MPVEGRVVQGAVLAPPSLRQRRGDGGGDGGGRRHGRGSPCDSPLVTVFAALLSPRDQWRQQGRDGAWRRRRLRGRCCCRGGRLGGRRLISERGRGEPVTQGDRKVVGQAPVGAKGHVEVASGENLHVVGKSVLLGGGEVSVKHLMLKRVLAVGGFGQIQCAALHQALLTKVASPPAAAGGLRASVWTQKRKTPRVVGGQDSARALPVAL